MQREKAEQRREKGDQRSYSRQARQAALWCKKDEEHSCQDACETHRPRFPTCAKHADKQGNGCDPIAKPRRAGGIILRWFRFGVVCVRRRSVLCPYRVRVQRTPAPSCEFGGLIFRRRGMRVVLHATEFSRVGGRDGRQVGSCPQRSMQRSSTGVRTSRRSIHSSRFVASEGR